MTTASRTATVPQATFPGQAAAPPGPVDLMPMYLMHHAFRRDLRKFAAAAARTPIEDRDTWRALAKRWGQFARVLHHHHSGEDKILWPLLLARVDAAGDSAGRETLEAMEAEHDEIDPLLTGCADGLARLAAGPDSDARAALVVRMTATLERLGQHLGHEEHDAMALVQRHLTPAEWHGMHAEFSKEYTPADGLFALPWVRHEIPAELRPPVIAFIGRFPILLWRAVLRRRFSRGERRTFQYASA